MMIPSIAAPATNVAPARDAGASATESGFEQAMAAALGTIPGQQPAPVTTITEPEVSLADTVVGAILADGAPSAGTETPMLTQPGAAIGTDAAHPVLTGHGTGAERAGETESDGASPSITDTTEADRIAPPEGSGSPTAEPAEVAAPEAAVSSYAAVMAAQASLATGGALRQATSVAQVADHTAITAQGLGLRTLRVSGGTTTASAGAITDGNAPGAPSAVPPGIEAPATEVANQDAAAFEEATPDAQPAEQQRPVAPVRTDQRSERFRLMPEQAGPGGEVAVDARLSTGTERPDRAQPNHHPVRPELPSVDPLTGTADQVTTQPTVPGATVETGSTVPSGMLQRVEDAIRRLENAPPPRSITLTIDDQGLTRVTVSMLSDGVRLTVPDGAQAPTGLVQDLEQALSNRGFELSRDGEQRHRQRPDHDDAPPTAPRAAPRRITADTGVQL